MSSNEGIFLHTDPSRAKWIRHLTWYIVVCEMLFLLNLVTYTRHLWSIYPAVCWGAGLDTIPTQAPVVTRARRVFSLLEIPRQGARR
jgi:hypothetical protein